MTGRLGAGELQGEALRRAIDTVYQLTGVTLADAKRSMLQGRLRSRMKQLQVDTFDAYLDRVDRDPAERQAFIDTVTTHQTQFFRTPRVWKFLTESFLPQWQREHRPGDPLLAWSAAASTGEEAYSLAMVLEEHRQALDQRGIGFDYRILATDISAQVLETAAQGRYCGTSSQQLQLQWPDRFARFNSAVAAECFHASEALRKHLRFGTCNLLGPSWPGPREHDLVLLRNVLIYFDARDSLKLLARLAERMKPGATLVLGESESLNGMNLPFRFVEPQVYLRLP
jgi:chemotaxis protein methyltransferase CheR